MEGVLRAEDAKLKDRSISSSMYSLDSLSTLDTGFRGAPREPVLWAKLLEPAESKRDLLVCDEMYSVLRRKETPESTVLGFPKEFNGRNSARSCG